MALSQQDLALFDSRGFLGPFTLFEPEEMKLHWKQLRLQLFNRTHAVYADTPPSSTLYNYDRHLDNPFLAGLVCRTELVSRVASILGPDVLCWRSEFLPKYPGEDGHAWRQAHCFGGLSDGIPHVRWAKSEIYDGGVTVWITFTGADEETGCMQFIPGTHRTIFFDDRKAMRYDPTRTNWTEVNGIRRGYFGYDWRDIQVVPNWEPDESKAISVPCRAGQFIMYCSGVLHSSLPHPGNTSRVQMAMTIRYAPTSVTIYDDMKNTNSISEAGASASLEKYGAVLVSGIDEYKRNAIRTHTTTGIPFINSCPR